MPIREQWRIPAAAPGVPAGYRLGEGWSVNRTFAGGGRCDQCKEAAIATASLKGPGYGIHRPCIAHAVEMGALVPVAIIERDMTPVEAALNGALPAAEPAQPVCKYGPCACGHAADDHGHDPNYHGSTACDSDSPDGRTCDCVAYEEDVAEPGSDGGKE